MLCRAKPRGECIVGSAGELCNLDEGELDEQSFVLALTVVEVAVGTLADGGVEEARLAAFGLFGIALTHFVGGFEQAHGL